MYSTYSGRLEPVVRVWDGAGRRNGRAYSERCFLIEMDRAVFVEKMDRQTGRDTARAGQTHGQTSRDHETGPADGQTHCSWCWQQAKQANDSASDTDTDTNTDADTGQARGHRMGYYYLDLDMRRIPGERN